MLEVGSRLPRGRWVVLAGRTACAEAQKIRCSVWGCCREGCAGGAGRDHRCRATCLQVGGIGVCRGRKQLPGRACQWVPLVEGRAQLDQALHSEPGAQPALGTTCWGHTERCPWMWVQLLQTPPLKPPNLPPSPASTPAASTPRLRHCGEVWMASDNLGFISAFSQLNDLGLVAAFSWICHL